MAKVTYASQYPDLYSRYQALDNFEQMMSAIDRHFSHLFKLNLLDKEAKESRKGSYLVLFDDLTTRLKGLYTDKEIIQAIYLAFEAPEFREQFIEKFFFTPPGSQQIGLLEKIITSQYQFPEALTTIDIIRVIDGFKKYCTTGIKISGWHHNNTPVVLNVAHLAFLDRSHLTSSKFLIVNFNLSISEDAKWGLVALTSDGYHVFCETIINEDAKRAFESYLPQQKITYKPSRSTGNISTAYTALADWIEQASHEKNLMNTRFVSLFSKIILYMTGGDNEGIDYACDNADQQIFMASGQPFVSFYQAIKAYLPYKHQINGAYKINIGYLMTLLNRMSLLGTVTLTEAGHEKTIRFREGEITPLLSHSHLFKRSLISELSNVVIKYDIFGFDHTLCQLKYLLVNKGKSILVLNQAQKDSRSLMSKHEKICEPLQFNSHLLDRAIETIYDEKSSFTDYQINQRLMLLNFFTSQIKQKALKITVQDSNLTIPPPDIDHIIGWLSNNPFIQEFVLDIKKESPIKKGLEAIQTQGKPIFARNRLLAMFDYHPPMIADYWREAAKDCLIYLNEFDVLAQRDQTFERCIHEMGLKGLRSVLDFLNDESNGGRALIERVYGENKPLFYASCASDVYEDYLNELNNHIMSGNYFPFGELSLSYQQTQTSALINMLHSINGLEKFSQIILTDCLKADPQALQAFLQQLLETAMQAQWCVPIVIPEWSDGNNLHSDHQQLYRCYTLLNDIIVINRHQLEKEQYLQNIIERSNFKDIDFVTQKENQNHPRVEKRRKIISEQENFHQTLQELSQELTWPLQKEGDTQLQVQQQQEIQQERQIQKEQERIIRQVVDEPIIGELVSYGTVERLMCQYFEKYCEDNVYSDKAARLKIESETPLQGLFRTWINANPTVDAYYVIHSMTQDAFKALLRQHHYLTAGLNPENLPKGFFTQRSKEGHLILCYKPALAHVDIPNDFTLDFIKPKECRAWRGDFRQLELKRYLSQQEVSLLDDEDWERIILFATLQPEIDCDQLTSELIKSQFPKKNLNINAKESTMAMTHWRVFSQVWEYAGEQGIAAFKKKCNEKGAFTLEVNTAKALLFRDTLNDNEMLGNWANQIAFTLDDLRAIGQVKAKYGTQGLHLFLLKLYQIESVLGRAFFQDFQRNILSTSQNYNDFMNVSFFETVDKLIAVFSQQGSEEKKAAWQKISALHSESVGFDNIQKLWRAFSAFVEELDDLGLALDGTEFNKMPAQNMMVCLERILLSLKLLPGEDKQKDFLSNLHLLDLNHGGVHYAIQKEGFRHFDPEIYLTDFQNGSPTYAPNLIDLYQWTIDDHAALKMHRAICSKGQWSVHGSQTIQNFLLMPAISAANLQLKRNQLSFLLYTRYDDEKIEFICNYINELNIHTSPLFELFAIHLNGAVEKYGHQFLSVSFDTVLKLIKLQPEHDLAQKIECAFSQAPEGSFAESLSILSEKDQLIPQNFEKLIVALNANKPGQYPVFLKQNIVKLIALFGINKHQDNLEQFYEATTHLAPVVQNELDQLLKQLFAIDYQHSDLNALDNDACWGDLIRCIESMQQNLSDTKRYRIEFLQNLTKKGLKFKTSITGDWRCLDDKDKPSDLASFPDHEARLWRFMQKHILVPKVNDKAGNHQESLQPIMLFLKRLQVSQTYLNEIEPLLALLEKTAENHYWTAPYFYRLLRMLQVNEESAFPISVFKILLEEAVFSPRLIDSIQTELPTSISDLIQEVLRNTIFTRDQQAMLTRIILLEYQEKNRSEKIRPILNLVNDEASTESRTYILHCLLKEKTFTMIEKQFNHIVALKDLKPTDCTNDQWAESTKIWLKALAENHSSKVTALFESIKRLSDQDKARWILYIVSYSTLAQGLKDPETYQREINIKGSKLIEALEQLTVEQLKSLASFYPDKPSPSATQILQSIKSPPENLIQTLKQTTINASKANRPDHRILVKTRDDDLQRLILETCLSGEKSRQAMNVAQATRLILIFSTLKQLEEGTRKLQGYDRSITELSPDELKQAFQRLSQQAANSPQDDDICIQLWAVLFEALGRTTAKYPHLAQQFALIASEVCIDADSRILQLATGEGKSHFVALRAAKLAGMGKTVDVCTAKKTLADRDLEDYQAFFDKIGLKASVIHPKSSRESYTNSHIHFTTLGELSLFFDEQSYSGNAINIDPQSRVALMDEFDFTYFQERRTTYNYARPTGKTPKQMNWFYQAVNAFYWQRFAANQNKKDITVQDLIDFNAYLNQLAGENESKQALLNLLIKNDKRQLIQWLQSSHDAHRLAQGIHFTVREQFIQIGQESYPMREIIPLSSDNQRMEGSTFSAGVHQLLAVRLNTDAKAVGKSQNYHIHAESHIVSSQVAAYRMKNLYSSWEGFSGTISGSQAKQLNCEYDTKVLHVPTNQRDLRKWHSPEFYQHDEDRIDAIVAKTKAYFNDKKSILFCCQNDAKVNELKAALEAKLSADEFAQLIFYTNDEHKQPTEVLAEKYEAETWIHGKKEKGIGLVASGFGRGDNVGVDVVFLMDVLDDNDKRQKGGRTARNGSHGEVIQCYLSQELADEKESLIQIAKFYLGKEHEHCLDAKLGFLATDKNEQEACFEQVLFLRELMKHAENMSTHHYCMQIAALSTWAMKVLRKIDDPAQKEIFVGLLSALFKELDKEWIDVSSDKTLSIDDKKDTISNKLREKQTLFCDTVFENIGIELPQFVLNNEAQIALVDMLDVYEKEEKSPEALSHEKGLTAFYSLIASLNVDLSDPSVRQLPDAIQKLWEEGRQIELLNFYDKIAHSKDSAEFASDLKIFLSQVYGEAAHFKRAVSPMRTPKDNIFVGLDSGLVDKINQLMGRLVPTLQESLAVHFEQASCEHQSRRFVKAMPIFAYLAKMTREEQKAFGPKYIEQLVYLSAQHERQHWENYVAVSQAIPFKYFELFWEMIQSVQVESSMLEDLAAEFKNAILDGVPSDDIRLKLLNRWENATKILAASPKKTRFLRIFLKTLAQNQQGDHWDILNDLMTITESNSDQVDDSVRNKIMHVWTCLTQKPIDADTAEFMRWALKLPGKASYQLLFYGLHFDRDRALMKHHTMFKSWWDHLGQRTKKREKIKIFRENHKTLKAIVDSLDKTDQKDDVIDQLTHLDPEKSLHLMAILQKNEKLLDPQHVNMLSILIQYAAKDKSLNELDLYSNILLKWIDFSTDNPNDSAGDLIALIQSCQTLTEAKLVDIYALFDLILKAFSGIPAQRQTLFKVIVGDEISKAKRDLCERLLTVFLSLKEKHSDDRLIINDLSTAVVQFIQNEPPIKFGRLLDLYESNSEKYLECPKAFLLLIECIAEGNKDPKLDIFNQLIFKTIELQKKYPGPDLFQKLKERKDLKEREYLKVDSLSILLALLDPAVSAAPFFDRTVIYILSLAIDDRADAIEIIKTLHAIDNTMDAQTIMKQENILCLFDNASWSENKKKRLIFMRLLDKGICRDQRFGIDDNKHEALKEIGFDHYIRRSQMILEGNPEARFEKTRDLAPAQESKLLDMAKELGDIGTPNIYPKSENALEAEITKLKDQYDQSWFKSLSRKALLLGFKKRDEFQTLLANFNQDCSGHSYLHLMTKIHAVKIDVMKADRRENGRFFRRFFKMHRGGESRLLKTLNQMHDMVLKHCLKDCSGIQYFQNYQEIANQHLIAIVSELKESVEQYHEELNRDAKLSQCQRFFVGGKRSHSIDDVKNFLDGHFESGQFKMDNLEALQTLLKQHQKDLPGHIQVIANEVLAHSGSLDQKVAAT